MWRLFRFRNLQQKLGFYAFVLSLIAMVIVSVLTYRVARQQVRQDREQLMESLVREVAHDLENELGDAVNDVLLWGDMAFLRQSLKRASREPLEIFLNDLIRHHRQYDMILAITPDGQIFAINTIGPDPDGSGEKELNTRPLLGRSYSEVLPGLTPDWFEKTLEGKQIRGIPWRQFSRINEIYGRDPSLHSNEKCYQIALAVPIESHEAQSKTASGVFVAVLNWSHFQSVLDRVSRELELLDLKTGYAYLFDDRAETVIGHKYRDPKDPRNKNVYGTGVVRDHNLQELHDRAIQANPAGAFGYTWREGRKMAALNRVFPPKALGSGFEWRLGVGINEDDIFAPIVGLRNWFVIIPMLLALSLVLLNSYLGRSVSVSLNEITELARATAQGKFRQLAPAQTDDEVGELSQAFNEMLVSFRKRLPFTQIPNPYAVGVPVRGSEMFYGREEDLQWAAEHIRRKGNEMILLVGPRRIGKTSLLHRIRSGIAIPNIVPFFFDTQEIIPDVNNDADFYHVLGREMLKQIPTVMPGSVAPFFPADRFGPEVVRRLLQHLSQTSPNKNTVLLFDELENIEFKFDRNILSADVMLFLAGILESETPVSLIATGSREVESLRSPHWKIIHAKCITRKIGMLRESDARRLILEPSHGQVIYDQGAVEAILRLSGGHPYYTQLLCQLSVDQLNQHHEFTVTDAVLTEVMSDVLNNPPPPLSDLWEDLSDGEKSALSILSQAIGDPQAFAGFQELIAAVPAELEALSRDSAAIRSALESLKDRELVEKNGSAAYRVRMDLIRRWVRREHSMWHVADELLGSTAD